MCVVVCLRTIGVWDGRLEGWLVGGEQGCVECREAVWGGGVGRVDCLFGLELLCLDCCMCDLYFDRDRSVSEDGVA